MVSSPIRPLLDDDGITREKLMVQLRHCASLCIPYWVITCYYVCFLNYCFFCSENLSILGSQNSLSFSMSYDVYKCFGEWASNPKTCKIIDTKEENCYVA